MPLAKSSEDTMHVEPIKLAAVDVNGYEYGSELVRINEHLKGKKYRYSYGFTGFAGNDDEKGGFNIWAIVKLDHCAALNMQSVTCKIWKSPNCYPSETIFVPAQKPMSCTDPLNVDFEDDGILISQVYDTNKRETFLLILDAKNMTELARCYTGKRCPISFHGCFIPNNSEM